MPPAEVLFAELPTDRDRVLVNGRREIDKAHFTIPNHAAQPLDFSPGSFSLIGCKPQSPLGLVDVGDTRPGPKGSEAPEIGEAANPIVGVSAGL